MSLPYVILTVLLLITIRQHLQRICEKCSVRPAHHEVGVKSASPWLQSKSALPFELKGCKMFHKRHYKHSQAQSVSRWTGSICDISLYVTSRDSPCIQTEHLLALSKQNQVKNVALRENYRDNGHIKKTQQVLDSTVTALLEFVVARLRPPDSLKYLVMVCGRTDSAYRVDSSKDNGFLEVWRCSGEYNRNHHL